MLNKEEPRNLGITPASELFSGIKDTRNRVDLPELKRRLDQAFNTSIADPRPQLGGLIAELGHPNNVVPLLQTISSDPEHLSDSASRSYSHSNGFDKIVLFSGADYKLRLHLWWPEGERTTENVRQRTYMIIDGILLQRF
jgi:hypothetical protein